MEKLEKLFDKYGFWVILVLTLPTVIALLMPGFYGASDEVHIGWLFEMDRVVRSGQFPPRFVPDLSFGFGYPLFNFVFPLPFYIGELFHLIGFSLVDSVKLVFFLSIPTSAIFMYFLLRDFTNKSLSVLGAVLYIFGPYRAVDLYIRGAIGEIVAFVFLPLIALAVVKLTKKEVEDNSAKLRWVGIGGLSLAMLVLSHNIATYMFMPFIIVLALIRIFTGTAKKIFPGAQVGMMMILGLLGSIYFWLPALLDSQLMKYDTVFNFVDHFPTIKQLFTPYWGYGASVPGPGDGISFFLGVSNILVVLVCLICMAVLWKKYTAEQKNILVWALVSLFVVLFMMNYRSSFIWQNLPLLPYFQFPWRFLIMATFLIPVLVISLEKIKFQWAFIMVLLVVTVGINYQYFRPQDFLGREDQYFLNKYIPYPEASEEYKLTQEEYLRLPKNTQIRPDKNYPLIYDETGAEIGQVKRINTLDVYMDSSFNKSTLINYSKYYFPGWQAQINGQKMTISPGSPFGQITLIVPAGIHQVKIFFSDTNFKLALDLISLLSIVSLIGLIVWNKKHLNVKQ